MDSYHMLTIIHWQWFSKYGLKNDVMAASGLSGKGCCDD